MRRATILLLLLTLLACDSGYGFAKVTRMAHIDTPSNLLATEECRALWADIQRFGLEMDKAGPEWNEVLIESAYELVERGCVKQRAVTM